MLVILLLMIAAVSLSAFAAPIGSVGPAAPPLRMMSPGFVPPQAVSPTAPATPQTPGLMPRGSLLNLSV